MTQRILITGGARFIGSHVADELLEAGYRVRLLDTLSPQVHGPDAVRPAYLHKEIELIIGDVRDRETMDEALRGVDAVFHFAALVAVCFYGTDGAAVLRNIDGSSTILPPSAINVRSANDFTKLVQTTTGADWQHWIGATGSRRVKNSAHTRRSF